MTGRTHDLAAISALGIIAIIDPPKAVTLGTVLIAVLANQIGGIAPDIDQPTAPLWKNLPVGKYFGKITDKMLGGHRFLTHSLLGLAIFSALSYALISFIHPLTPHVDIAVVWWAFFIGMLSHLVLDTFTKEGVPWLLPLPVKFGIPPVKSLRISTGKAVESFVVFPLIILVDIWLCINHYNQILSLIHQHIV